MISDSPFLQVKVSVVNSVGGSFCWNYAIDTFHSNNTGANVCCNYEGFEVLLRCWIPNPGVQFSKPLGCSKVDSAFHPSEVDKTSTRNFWEHNGKK